MVNGHSTSLIYEEKKTTYWILGFTLVLFSMLFFLGYLYTINELKKFIILPLVGVFFGLSLNYFKYGLININWHIAMFLTTLGIGFFYFGERYSMQEYAGIVLGLLALILLMTGKKHD